LHSIRLLLLTQSNSSCGKGKLQLKVTILGCGTSTGVPIVQCKCAVCLSKDPKNRRLRASAWIQVQGKNILIDTSTDLREQALRAKIPRVDAVLYTHPHADHIHGIDELRSFNFFQKEAIPIYGNAWTCEDLTHRFSYIFQPPGIVEGGGVPLLQLHNIKASSPFLEILGQKVIPLSLMHGSKECVGYRLNSFAYITDCNYIPPQTLARLNDLSVLILDCLRITPHTTHLNLDQALAIVQKIKPKRTFLTHLGHDFDYVSWKTKLPKGVALAYDGLTLRV
jgi:phosphoribosyl 1,2-cyclic phosphate phosphodiesterase